MIALDTNILVYARRRDSKHHRAAQALLARLAGGREPWALPWPCVYEFLRVVTHPRVFDPPSDLETVLEDLASLLDAPSLELLGEGSNHSEHLFRQVGSGQAGGNLAHDRKRNRPKRRKRKSKMICQRPSRSPLAES